MVTGLDLGEAFTANATARINLVHTRNKHYVGVQQQILGAITRHLAPEEFSTTVGQRVPGSLAYRSVARAAGTPAGSNTLRFRTHASQLRWTT